MLLDNLKSDLIAAQKARDQVKIDTLRYLLGAIHDLEIAKYPPSSRLSGTSEGHSPPASGGSLTDEDVLSVIAKQVKTHKESIEGFTQGGRQDLVSSEQSQLAILQAYLPEQMGESDIRNKIEEVRKNNPGADFGILMKLCMAELKGRADGTSVSKILRELLQLA